MTSAIAPNWVAEAALGDYEHVLTRWRRVHATEREGKRYPAPAVEAIIALARLGIYAPGSHHPDCYVEQHDRHCEFMMAQEYWRIVGIADRMLLLRRGWPGEMEERSVDFPKDWSRYIEAAAAYTAALK